MKLGKLESLIRRHGAAGVDTSVLIYHFQALPPLGALAADALGWLAEEDGFFLSTLTLTELLVKPLQSDAGRGVKELEQALESFPGLTWVAPDYRIAREAARLGARYGLKLADAVILATTIQSGAKVFLTNDGDFRKVRSREAIEIAVLEDYLEVK